MVPQLPREIHWTGECSGTYWCEPSNSFWESSPSGSVDAPQGMATVAVVRRPSQAHQVSHTLACGQTVAGRFRILRFIGSGGMGEVFEAWDSELRERVALKTIRHEIASFPSVIDRFKQEVRQARGISHVNVCRVYE